ncbi:hypothetical protein JOF56_007158 [Kibdelosporangium banguiense]|uniref:Uncharacterized protein n=1 Tax=Kibdelosporangium banguiense TaxID=1365924 RepID=A0ABS4TQT6_9PSEU|nr:hypothetical protein [Kibdelosporangium banguiense]MBP2326773.1 hypothetical protein [Kibdelosporangium banguiense]
MLAASTTRRLLDRLAPALDLAAERAVAALPPREREMFPVGTDGHSPRDRSPRRRSCPKRQIASMPVG